MAQRTNPIPELEMSKTGFEGFDRTWLTTERPQEAAEQIWGSKPRQTGDRAGEAIKRASTTKVSKEKMFIESVLNLAGIEYTKEYKFMPDRKFRFDWAFWHQSPRTGNIKVAIEYEGIVAGKSRHTTLTGYTNDVRKYNFAALDEWILLRYTALNYRDFAEHLQQLLK